MRKLEQDVVNLYERIQESEMADSEIPSPSFSLVGQHMTAHESTYSAQIALADTFGRLGQRQSYSRS